MKYRVLRERLAVCRTTGHAQIPDWGMQGEFFCVVRTPDEVSIVCPESACPENRVASDGGRFTVERGWVALKLEGPFPFSMTGVLASFLDPLAQAGIPIFAISTFDTDYVLIKEEHLKQALAALGGAGHEAQDECRP